MPGARTFDNFDHLLADGGSCGQALNSRGEIAGFYYTDGGKEVRGFVRSADGKKFNTIDHPQGVGKTMVFGMNDKGQVVGYYTDDAGTEHGFLATPQS